MNVDEVRWLFGYDRWATEQLLNQIEGLNDAAWAEPGAVGDRSLGQVLVHQLGATQRWRMAFQSEGDDDGSDAELEDQPLPTPEELRELWQREWVARDAWLTGLSQGFVDYVHGGVPVWRMLAHVVNHGTQHRSEAAALLTAQGRSPGELDLIDYAEGQGASG